MPSSIIQPPTWERLARNHIPGRDWEEIRGVWSAAARGFEPEQLSDLSETLSPMLAADFGSRESVSVFSIKGIQVSAFQDVAAILLKSTYVLRAVAACLLNGQPTWAAVDAYHFSFLSCRALLALLGIHLVQIADLTCVLDVFPTGRLDQTIKKFRKQYGSLENPVRLIFQERSRYIEQSAMWAILVRALNTATLPVGLRNDLDKVTELSAGFGRMRNELLYRNSSWLYVEDFGRPTCDVHIEDDIHSYDDLSSFFSNNKGAIFAFAAVFARVLFALVSEVQAQSGVNLLPTSYGPCLVKFPGFKQEKLQSLFATIYRCDAYGTDL